MQSALWWIYLGLASWLSAPGMPGVSANLSHVAPTDATHTLTSSSAAFSVEFKGVITSSRVNLVTALPGDSIEFHVLGNAPASDLSFDAEHGRIEADGSGRWWWHAPFTRGHTRIVVRSGTSEAMVFNAFVMVAADDVNGGVLNGYRIGEYPSRPLRGLDIYLPPRGFIEVTPENQDVLVSPNFRLGQFLAKQEGGFPKYVVLTESLILKLEYLLGELNSNGISAKSFFVMSGYRTPSYNRAIGNVQYSRHVYGAAADIFVDENPRDGQMDDLNGDNRIDVKDAQVLIDIVNAQLDKPEYAGFIGGLGRYRANASHGPFVHVDVRDRPARW